MEQERGKLLRFWPFVAAAPIAVAVFWVAAYVAHWTLAWILSNANRRYDLIPASAFIISIAAAILLIITAIRRRRDRARGTLRHSSSQY